MNEAEFRGHHRWAVLITSILMAGAFLNVIIAWMLQMTGFQAIQPPISATLTRYFFLGCVVSEFVAIGVIRSRRLAAPSADPASHVAKLRFVSLFSAVMAEFMANYGLLFFLLYGSWTDLLLFVGLSLLCFAVLFPRFENWRESTRERFPGQVF